VEDSSSPFRPPRSASLRVYRSTSPTAPPIYCALLALFVVLFAGAYAWLALQPNINRPLVAFAAIGKAGAFAVVFVFSAWHRVAASYPPRVTWFSPASLRGGCWMSNTYEALSLEVSNFICLRPPLIKTNSRWCRDDEVAHWTCR